jgi:hypothetical protein
MQDDPQQFHLSELDEAWAHALAEAEQRARALGRTDIATYLALRTSNDLLRKTATDWLLAMFLTVAGEANRTGAGIGISNEDGHRFKVGNATMVGTRLTLNTGIRRLFIEVGWPRTPRDGFIRGGGLARANIKHLGIKSADQQLRLVVSASGSPGWTLESPVSEPCQIHEADIRLHVAMLLDQSKKKYPAS